MAFADDFAALNETYFFREFTYSQTTFRPTPAQEVELADSVIWLGNLLVIFQLKERGGTAASTHEGERRWFERKVLRQATRQVRQTLAYLHGSRRIELRNHRNHTFALSLNGIGELHKLVVYLPHELLPEAYRRIKHHRSRTVGFIHILPAMDYLGIVQTLLTPAEVVDYLSFRETLVGAWEAEALLVPEQALVGQYLHGDLDTPPAIAFVEYLERLEHRAQEWDMSGVITAFPDRVTTDNRPTDYYPIVREIALLKRNELREFKRRFQISVEKARANEFARPYRMACPRTGCGFVFVPLTQDLVEHRRIGLQNLTLAHKYDQRLLKCLGVSFAPAEGGWFTAEWCYVELPWVANPELEEWLTKNNPFRDVRSVELNRYTYQQEQ